MAFTQKQKAAIEKFNLSIPEGTDSTVVDLIISKHQDVLKLKSENEDLTKTVDEAETLAEKQEQELDQLREKEYLNSSGYGEFSIGKTKYVIAFPRTIIRQANTKDKKVVTAQNLLDSESMQKEFVKSKYGMVVKKSDWEKNNKSQIQRVRQNLEKNAAPANAKILL